MAMLPNAADMLPEWVILLLSLVASWSLSLARMPYTALFPASTRMALAQLADDLRTTNSIDRSFWQPHISNLRPKTWSGWLGFVAFMTMSLSILSGLACCIVVSAALLAYVSAATAVITAICVGVAAFISFVALLFTAVIAGSVGLTLLAGYVGLRACGLVGE